MWSSLSTVWILVLAMVFLKKWKSTCCQQVNLFCKVRFTLINDQQPRKLPLPCMLYDYAHIQLCVAFALIYFQMLKHYLKEQLKKPKSETILKSERINSCKFP